MRARSENSNGTPFEFYTVRVRWEHADRTLKKRLRTKCQRADGSAWILHNLCLPKWACSGCSVSLRLAYRGRAERSHSVYITYKLHKAYTDNFSACIKFLDVRNELRLTSVFNYVRRTLAQRSPDLLSKCISVWQRMPKRRHVQTVAILIRFSVMAT